MASSGITVRVDHDELEELRRGIQSRRAELEKIRSKMEGAGLSTFTVDTQIEVIDRCKVALGDEPEDMFSGLDASEDVDTDTGEITGSD